jgi:hypothetical protein
MRSVFRPTRSRSRSNGISEGQRYVSKVLNEKALGAGVPQEVSVRSRDAEHARKSTD